MRVWFESLTALPRQSERIDSRVGRSSSLRDERERRSAVAGHDAARWPRGRSAARPEAPSPVAAVRVVRDRRRLCESGTRRLGRRSTGYVTRHAIGGPASNACWSRWPSSGRSDVCHDTQGPIQAGRRSSAAAALGGAAATTTSAPARARAASATAGLPVSYPLGPFVRDRANPILRPTNRRWESRFVFNPAAIVKDGLVHLLMRARAGRAILDRTRDLVGWCPLRSPQQTRDGSNGALRAAGRL